MTWGIWWSVSAAKKDGERGGRFPTMRHEHLLGLIRRSHSPAQAEEREESRRLDWDRGNTIFTAFAKFIINKKSSFLGIRSLFLPSQVRKCSPNAKIKGVLLREGWKIRNRTPVSGLQGGA